jgi:hypothetical protein
MKTLELREEERAELETLVTGRMSDLLMEIAGTNSLHLREALTRRAILLKEMLDNLGQREAEPDAP